jgi:hypothetical protein
LRKQIIGKSVEKFECCCKVCELDMEDQEIEESKLIKEYVDRILKTDVCPKEIYDILMSLFCIGKDVGWTDHKDLMIEFLSDE